MNYLKTYVVIFFMAIICTNMADAQSYTFPDETETHEGTWLQWPHQYEYGMAFRNENDATWVAMTNALQANENVHIIAYNATEQARITNLLTAANVPLTHIDFKVFQTNDVWVRDNGPIYVRNASGSLVIEDWGFNGWGGDYNFTKCNPIPTKVATATSMPVIDLNSVMTVEGGAYEMDGHGVFLATKSAILSQSNPNAQIKSIRNLGMTVAQANAIFTQYLGATKFYWLAGAFSTDDITDFHIDGFAKFVPGNKLVTMSQADLLYWGVTQADINILFGMTNTSNVAYTKVFLPLTQNNVFKIDGTDLGYKGSYANYYVANNRVLVPNYNDPNDAAANTIIAGLYPGRTVVGIDVRNLYGNGGMVHCVTQQQPLATIVQTNKVANSILRNVSIYPNPAQSNTNIVLNLVADAALKIEIHTLLGEKVVEIPTKNYTLGENIVVLNTDKLTNGLYICQIIGNNTVLDSQKFVIAR
jgi:agmatine deiminase